MMPLHDHLRSKRARVARLIERRRDALRRAGTLYRASDERLRALYAESERLLCEIADTDAPASVRRIVYRKRARS